MITFDTHIKISLQLYRIAMIWKENGRKITEDED